MFGELFASNFFMICAKNDYNWPVFVFTELFKKISGMFLRHGIVVFQYCSNFVFYLTLFTDISTTACQQMLCTVLSLKLMGCQLSVPCKPLSINEHENE